MYIPAPNRPKFVRWPAFATRNDVWRKRSRVNQNKLVGATMGTGRKGTLILPQSEQAELRHVESSKWLSPMVHARMVPCQRRLLFPPGKSRVRSTARRYRANSSLWALSQKIFHICGRACEWTMIG